MARTLLSDEVWNKDRLPSRAGGNGQQPIEVKASPASSRRVDNKKPPRPFTETRRITKTAAPGGKQRDGSRRTDPAIRYSTTGLLLERFGRDQQLGLHIETICLAVVDAKIVTIKLTDRVDAAHFSLEQRMRHALE